MNNQSLQSYTEVPAERVVEMAEEAIAKLEGYCKIAEENMVAGYLSQKTIFGKPKFKNREEVYKSWDNYYNSWFKGSDFSPWMHLHWAQLGYKDKIKRCKAVLDLAQEAITVKYNNYFQIPTVYLTAADLQDIIDP